MCEVFIDDPCDVWDENARTARKQHRCSGCGGGIEPGDAYNRIFMVHDGYSCAEKECFGCWFIRKAFVEAHGSGYAPSGLVEMLQDCVGGDGPHSEWRHHLASVRRQHRGTFRPRRAV